LVMNTLRHTLVALVAFLLAADQASGAELVELDDNNLERHFFNSIGRDWIILFINRKVSQDPALEQAFQEFAEQEEGFRVGKVDCHLDPDLCLDHRVSKRSGPVVMLVTSSGDKIKYTKGENTPKAWASWAHEARQGSVKVLTHQTFSSSISEGQWFVKFYAPWCSHCHQMEPLWREFAAEHKNQFNVAMMDCTLPGTHAICEEQGVQAFPTLIFYVNGERYPHVGQRSKEDFLRTVKLAWRGLIDEDNPDDDELKPQFEKPADGKSDPYEKVEL
jgi:thiol-disulfide isomerase/thioredoxin